jgi:hypothetical protein
MIGPISRPRLLAIAVRLLVAVVAIAATVAFTYCLLRPTTPAGDSTTPTPRPPSLPTHHLGGAANPVPTNVGRPAIRNLGDYRR